MWQAHRALWRVSGGRIGRTSGGHPVLELTTTGRVSGVPRMILIWYLTDDGVPIIAGTNAGARNDPAWIGNLRTDRSARVRVDGVLSEVEAEFLEGSDHDEAWARFLDLDPVYGATRSFSVGRFPSSSSPRTLTRAAAANLCGFLSSRN